jgi:hypothetical protein
MARHAVCVGDPRALVAQLCRYRDRPIRYGRASLSRRVQLAFTLLGLSLVVACGGSVVGEPGGVAGAGPGAEGGAPGSAGASTPSAGSGNSGNVGSSPGGAPSSAGAGGEAGATSVCQIDGQPHAIGERFACGCNTCWCEADGTISSTLVECHDRCEYAGKSYRLGETFPAEDGCNQCACEEFGQVSCTEALCSCYPEKEWNRHYAGLSAADCASIDYACPANTVAFSAADCGCGCEQDSDCPAWIDCEPGANNGCEMLKAQCPYSDVAY